MKQRAEDIAAAMLQFLAISLLVSATQSEKEREAFIKKIPA